MLYYPFHRMSSRFTAEGENARRKNGRIKDKSVRNVPGPIKEEREIREGKAKNKKGGTGKWERVESRKRHEADKEKLYYAEWRASCL